MDTTTAWIPAGTPPALEDGWVLAAIYPPDWYKCPYVDIVTHDERGWRSKWGGAVQNVGYWQRLPSVPRKQRQSGTQEMNQ